MANSELRQDIVSGDWILMAPGRARRPHAYKRKAARKKASKKNCPFENPLKDHESILIYEGRNDWEVVVIENKYPAVMHKNICAVSGRQGPYPKVSGVGHHDLIITRDHHNNFAHLSAIQANQVLEAFRDRYLMLLSDKCLAYISIFHNWGLEAGATVYHPHYQMLAVPVVPPDVEHSLKGSALYFKKHRQCVHCLMIDYERKEKKRIIYENKGAIVFAPFVSREPFELRIFPKKHSPYFENTLDIDLSYIADALQFALKRIEKKLDDADYNFFIHTAPLKNKKRYSHYHWHIEVLPKLNISAGFELSTGIEINVVDPDFAANILKHKS